MKFLEDDFAALLTRLTPSDKQARLQQRLPELWHNIHSHYSGKNRYYHGLSHIRDMLKLWSIYERELCCPEHVALAIWYHDVIYKTQVDTKNTHETGLDNEAQSAQYMQTELADLVPHNTINRVQQLILMTKSHQVSEVDFGSEDCLVDDAAYFLDMDLATLGAPWQVYKRYTQQIASEYAHLSSNTFEAGRKTVLQRFLQRERLYFTSAFYNKYEQQARANLQQELKLLSQ